MRTLASTRTRLRFHLRRDTLKIIKSLDLRVQDVDTFGVANNSRSSDSLQLYQSLEEVASIQFRFVAGRRTPEGSHEPLRKLEVLFRAAGKPGF